MNRIYVTHCSAKKDQGLKSSKSKVKPIDLYTSTPIRRFMKTCENKGVNWAIFSDKYGVWHSDQKHEWYEKNPNKVNEQEFDKLLSHFDNDLRKYDEIWFYNNPGRFHRLYARLVNASSLRNKIKLFSHIEEIRS